MVDDYHHCISTLKEEKQLQNTSTFLTAAEDFPGSLTIEKTIHLPCYIF